jgi:magnesium transporter
MNFEYVPELGWGFGYPFALFLTVLLGVVLFLIFKRRGWL